MGYLLFDFDGTLCNSLDLYLAVYNQYLQKHARQTITKKEFRSLGVLDIAAREKIPKWKLFWMVVVARRYTSKHIHELKPFRSIAKQLQKLSKLHSLGIVTSNSKGNILKFLRNNDLEMYFTFTESKISYFGKAAKLQQVIEKYNIDKSRCVYIGDETRDVRAAKQIGIKSVAVTWGFENLKLLLESQPDISITKQSLLFKSISKLFQKNYKRK